MNSDRERLKYLVKLAENFRRTPIVSDDFESHRNRFDTALDDAQLFLAAPRPKRAESKQYMLMETIGYGPKINGCDSWLCPYKDFASFLHDTLDGMDDPAQIATIRFTFMEMDDVEFEEYCVENGVEWEG